MHAPGLYTAHVPIESSKITQQSATFEIFPIHCKDPRTTEDCNWIYEPSFIKTFWNTLDTKYVEIKMFLALNLKNQTVQDDHNIIYRFYTLLTNYKHSLNRLKNNMAGSNSAYGRNPEAQT